MTEQQYTSVKSQIHTTGCRMLNFILNFFWKSEKMKDSSVQLFSCVRLFATPWTAACQAYLSILPGTCSNSCPLNRWCHPAISSSVTLFSSCLQSFPASGSFQMSQLLASSGHSIGVSASNISPSNEYSGLISFRMTGWISLQSKGLSRVFSNTTVQKHQFFGSQLSL